MLVGYSVPVALACAPLKPPAILPSGPDAAVLPSAVDWRVDRLSQVSANATQATATLWVQVDLAGRGEALPAPGDPPSSPTMLGPASKASVQIPRAEAGEPLTEQVADAQGQVRSELSVDRNPVDVPCA